MATTDEAIKGIGAALASFGWTITDSRGRPVTTTDAIQAFAGWLKAPAQPQAEPKPELVYEPDNFGWDEPTQAQRANQLSEQEAHLRLARSH